MDIARLKLARQGLGLISQTVVVEKAEVVDEALTQPISGETVESQTLNTIEPISSEKPEWTAEQPVEPAVVQPSPVEMDSISMQLFESSATEGQNPEDVATLDEPVLPSSTPKPSPIPGLLVSAAGAGLMATAALLGGKR